MSLIKVSLTHTGKKPQTTVISVNDVELFEVRTHSSDLTFIQEKISNSSGKSNPGEYYFDVEWRQS